MIPPAGISVLIINLFILIPCHKGSQISQRCFVSEKRKGIIHASQQISQGEQRRLAEVHTRSFLHIREEVHLVKFFCIAHLLHSFPQFNYSRKTCSFQQRNLFCLCRQKRFLCWLKIAILTKLGLSLKFVTSEEALNITKTG